MNVNMNGAARNCYDGVKALSDIIESYDDSDADIALLIEELNDSMVKYQPLLAAYCMNDHFNPEPTKDEQNND